MVPCNRVCAGDFTPPVSVRLKRIFVACCLVAATGCELVAGIKDLSYSASPDEGGTPSGDDATTDAAPQNEGDAAPEVSDDHTVQGQDAAEAGTGVDAMDAQSSDAPLESQAEATIGETGAEAATMDAAMDGDAGADSAVIDAADGEAGAVSYAVPIPGPDGGPLRATDGGVLMGELIDDIDTEITPGWILGHSGRIGTWFTYDDGTDGGIVPPPNSSPAACVNTIAGWDGNPSNMAANASGSGVSSYAGIGFDLNAYNGVSSTYDATAYQGFVFWGRIGGTSGTTRVTFAVPDRNTYAGAGGLCTGSTCGDYFEKSFTFTSSWQQFVVYYNQLGQMVSTEPAVDYAHMYKCQFQLLAGASFDIWVDDVYFIDR